MLISEPLCFLTRKHGRYADEDVKSVMYNFYNDSQLVATKELLAETASVLDIEALEKSFSRRRDSKDQT